MRKEETGRAATRREFVRNAAGAAAAVAWAPGRQARIFVLSDASDPAVGRPPVRWAVERLESALRERGLAAQVQYNLEEIQQPGERIVVAPSSSAVARQLCGRAGVSLPAAAESMAVAAGRLRNQPVLLATGADTRGLVYAVLELADRLEQAADAPAALGGLQSWSEQPFNSIRSVARLFVSDVEDKGWFHDRTFWRDYLSMLAMQRFNRFSLTLGLGYDLPRRVLDAYFIFAYPFLLSVPGYDVTVRGLPPAERDRNLETLQWISGQAAARGLHFQLGLWSHTYEWIDSPKANYTIQGLTPASHAPYCRDALRLLLQACPAIDGITFRAHSESGIPDGSYEFWETVFAGVAGCGRRVEIDLHSKGIEFSLIRMALETGQPVRVSPKLTAEHMGLPAHQAAIREMEMTRSSSTPQERRFTRYGYADYLPEERSHGVYFRIWPSMQKLLLWADPVLAAGYGRHAAFCGSLGLEVCDPLTFKGRQGSGLSPERRIYADDSLRPEGGDWRKYLYSYRVWGRHLYHPDASPDSCRRYLRREFGAAAAPVEQALGNAGRITPLITSAHLPAGSAMAYWPEMYTPMPIADASLAHPYGDSPSPKVFGRVSPLDPAMFSPVDEFVEEMIARRPSGRYSPAEVANWLEGFARRSDEQLSQARAAGAGSASFRRVEIDAAACNGLGIFFARMMRAAIAWTLHGKNGELDSLRDAVYFYRAARQAWAGLAQKTRGVYVDDLTFGITPQMRGHWTDRLAAIDRDLQFMERLLQEKFGDTVVQGPSRASSAWLAGRPRAPECRHSPPARFQPGQSLAIQVSTAARAVDLHYRHVNQAERWQVESMSGAAGRWRHAIPGSYTQSPYPLQYFFVVRDGGGQAWMYPGFEPDLANQPYLVVRRGSDAEHPAG